MTLYLTYSERKISSNTKKSQNIMTMIAVMHIIQELTITLPTSVLNIIFLEIPFFSTTVIEWKNLYLKIPSNSWVGL